MTDCYADHSIKSSLAFGCNQHPNTLILRYGYHVFVLWTWCNSELQPAIKWHRMAVNGLHGIQLTLTSARIACWTFLYDTCVKQGTMISLWFFHDIWAWAAQLKGTMLVEPQFTVFTGTNSDSGPCKHHSHCIHGSFDTVYHCLFYKQFYKWPIKHTI